MSIKNIDESYVGDDVGLAKKINKGAEKLVFDILQATQYSTPISSSIRELVTNACDSQREKEIAIEILSGEKQVTDYYITRHGDQYEDSNFKSDYYSIDHLDTVNNHIDIVYKKNKGIGYCDTLSIKDFGVGIGGSRLEGILELGFSTKRNTTQNFGAFGLGAKVALSTGVDFYTIETVYNGRRFKMNCFNYKTDFIIPKFNLTTGKENPFITLSNGMKVHYEEVSGTNWTEISFGVKSHNFNRFEEAIEEQLVYLDNVEFYVIDEDNSKNRVNFKSNILYNSNNLIVSDSWVYRKPHIVIVKEKGSGTGINYGFVDFKELEMEDLYGSVGLKCPIRQSYINDDGEEIVIQEGVEVTPSREKVIWSDNTKEFIQSLIDEASKEVTVLLEEELKEEDFLVWLDKCIDVTNSRLSSTNTAISTLSKIIDTTTLSPTYHHNKAIKFKGPTVLFQGFSLSIHRKNPKKVKKEDPLFIKSDVQNWAEISGKKVLYREGRRDQYRDYYFHNLYGDFVSIRKNNLDVDSDIFARHSSNQNLILPLIKKSSIFIDYDNEELPENIKSLFDNQETREINKNSYSNYLSPEEKRKLNQQIVIYTLREENSRRPSYSVDSFIWDKVEPVLSSFMSESTITYYGTEDDEDKLRLAAVLSKNYAPKLSDVFGDPSRSYSSWHPYADYDDASFYFSCLPSRYSDSWTVKLFDTSKSIQLIKISESNLKYVKSNPNYKHIDLFYRDVDDNGFYTCDKIYKDFCNYIYIKHRYPFLVDKLDENTLENCFDIDFINPKYNEIYTYVHKFIRKFNNPYINKINLFNTTNESDQIKELIEDVNKCLSFSKIYKDLSPTQLSELSSKLFVFSDIPGMDIYDAKLEELITFIIDFSIDSKHILPLIDRWGNLDMLAKKQVEMYLNATKATSISIPSL